MEYYGHIMAVLDRESGFGQNHSDPALYVRFPTLEERRAAREQFAKKCLNCGEDAYFARDCPKPFMNVSALIMSDPSTQMKQKKMAYMAWKTEKVLHI